MVAVVVVDAVVVAVVVVDEEGAEGAERDGEMVGQRSNDVRRLLMQSATSCNGAL